MIDPNLEVFRATKLGETEYFCDEELEEQDDAAKWQQGAQHYHARLAAETHRHAGRRISPGQPGGG